MNWVRKGFFHLLSLTLFVSLLGTALAVSIDLNLSHPDKIETWLTQSKLYDQFQANAINQAQQSAGNENDTSSVSLSDTAVQQAAQSAFSSQLLQQSVKTFLDGNYAWLQGKTATPSFTIDLSSAKQSFAQQVGAYVKAHLAGLPVCTATQLSQIDPNNIDPLTIPCRPATITPDAEAQQVTQKLLTSGFLSNPVITANNFNSGQDKASKPYYQKLSFAPKLYRLGVKLPWILAGLVVVTSLGVIFVAPVRRKGWRKVGILFTVAGVLLLFEKFVADAVVKNVNFTKLNSQLLGGPKDNTNGPLQHALVNFIQRAEAAFTKPDLYFGIAYIVIGVVVIIVLIRSRNRPAKAPGGISDGAAPLNQSNDPSDGIAPTIPAAAQINAKRPKKPTLDIMPGQSRPQPTTAPAIQKPSSSKNRKPPRLVQ